MQSQHNYQQHSNLPVYASMICGIAMLFYFFDYFIQVSPSVMTQQFMQHFHINARNLGILGACFYYSYLLMQIPAGILLDKFGARIMMSVAILTCATGVALVGQTNSFVLACVGRSLTGIGSAFSFIGAIYLIANWFSSRYFAALLGVTQSCASLGSLLGLMPLAYSVAHIGWVATLEYMSLATLLLGAISILCIRNHPHDIKQKTTSLNWSGILTVLKNKQLWLIACLGFCSWTPVATIGTLWGVPYLAKAYHLNTVKAGELCSLFWIGLGILSPTVGWLADKWQKKKFFVTLSFFIGSLSAIALLQAPNTGIWLSGMLLIGLSFASSAQSLTFALVKDQVLPNHLGYASGLNNMAAILGGAFAQTIVGFLLYHSLHGQHHLADYSIHAYKKALSVLPITLLVGLWISFFHIKERSENHATVKSVINDALDKSLQSTHTTEDQKEPYTLS
jgi:MFS family permease